MRIRRVPATIAAMLLGQCGASHAAWEVVPQLDMLVNTDDNILLERENKQSAASAVADLSVALTNFTERSAITITPRIVMDSYSSSEAKAFETEDRFLDAQARYLWSRVGLFVRTRYSDQIIINSELADVEPLDPDVAPGEDLTDFDPDTGRLLFFNDYRERLDLFTNLDYRLSERTSLRFDVARYDVDYTGSTDTGLRDFVSNVYGIALNRRVDERSTISARVSLNEFEAPAVDNSTDTVTVAGTFSRPLTETWTLALSAGVIRAKYRFREGDTVVGNASTSSTYTLGLRKRSERNSWNIDLSRDAMPWGNGFFAERLNLRAFVTHGFSPRLQGRLGVRFTRTESLDDIRDEDNRDYDRFEIGVDYALKETLFVFGGFDHVRQKFLNEDDLKVSSNSIFVGVSYRGRGRPR